MMIRAKSSINTSTLIGFSKDLHILLLDSPETCWNGWGLRNFVVLLVWYIFVKKVQMCLEIVQTKLSYSLPQTYYTLILSLRACRLYSINIFLIFRMIIVLLLIKLSGLSKISSTLEWLSVLMKLLFIRWKTINERRWHTFCSNRFTTLRKALLFCLCACTDTSALSNFLLWRLYFTDFFILCLESLTM